MVKNLKLFLRHLFNNKIYTMIIVFGFAFSLAFICLLSVYVKNELAVNSAQENKDRIYRLVNERNGNSAPVVGQWLKDKLPEIESFTRIYSTSGILSISNKKFRLKFLLADSSFFNIFTFKLIEGDKNTVLETKNSVVLSQDFAYKTFGNLSPVGKQIKISGIPCVVRGVVEDISKTSSFAQYDAIVNFKCLADIWGYKGLLTELNNCSFNIYFLAKPNANLPDKADQVLKMFKKDFWLYQNNRTKTVVFESLNDTYFSKIPGEGIKQNSKTLISVLLGIIMIILILAIINYMNLTIAQAGMRVKEIAVKKILGSSRAKLILQYIQESTLLYFFAFSLAVLFSFLAEPFFDKLLVTKLNLVNEVTFASFLISIVIISILGFISGIFPALFITNLKAIEVMKGVFRRKNKSTYSKVLIGFQFTVVIILLISTIIISNQTTFMSKHDLGFNHNNIVKLDFNIKTSEKKALKSEFMKIPGVKRVSYVSGSPVDGGNNLSFIYKDKPVSFQTFVVDSEFFKMMDIHVKPSGVVEEKNGIWLNKLSVKSLGLEPMPKTFNWSGKESPVLGIIDNFFFRSLHQKMGMVMIQPMQEETYPWSILLQLEGQSILSTMNKIKATYAKFTDNLPFEYTFFDNVIQKWYEKETRTVTILTYFAFLAIIISVMGIFGMSIFHNQQKIKEIGVRKVLGATGSKIVMLLSKDFIKWALISNLIAWPIAYYTMSKWLTGFAYRIDMTILPFLISGILALLIAMVTVSFQSIKAARANPVESLKYE